MAKQTENKVGIYLRLSQEDLREGDSVSIDNQRMILTKFVKEKGWTLVDTYADDGWTGTDFNRPEVQRLLDDAKSGRINIIVVKDLSRFGRNYIQVGQYIDYIFPLNNIRFIALNDGVDTADRNSTALEMMPIINLFNEWHASSTSKKIRAVVEANAKAGKYGCKQAAYGYIKGDDEKHTPIINPETAPVVLSIFQMRAQGISPRHIADKLNEDGILNPTDYHYSLLGKDAPIPMRHLWSGATVKNILKNRIYLGQLAQLRRTTVSHKNHKIVYKDESDWVIIENNHEPIVTQELWDKVREVEASVSRGKPTKRGYVDPLCGLMFCADCGFKMRLGTTWRGIKKSPDAVPYRSYNCTSYRLFGNNACESHYITDRCISKLILDNIRLMAKLVIEDETGARKKFLAIKNQGEAEKESLSRKKLTANAKRITELQGLIQSVYEDKYLGKITETACGVLLDKYETELKALQEEQARLTVKLDAEKQNAEDVDKFIERVKKYADVQTLTREMCLELIEYITIDKHPSDRKAERDIHIYYKFLDKSAEHSLHNLYE
ncbi:recombinase family protein [uncultured Ruminococcus sp.]|uniref:recombinase family protein n=1 Tax=uncultured Ruminococcus sp. TaxID=165186 RepID=UPI0025D679E7|nr:recombinase family protein [uncultured Ruminococcus sp.]